jgi:hypothetical protein
MENRNPFFPGNVPGERYFGWPDGFAMLLVASSGTGRAICCARPASEARRPWGIGVIVDPSGCDRRSAGERIAMAQVQRR